MTRATGTRKRLVNPRRLVAVVILALAALILPFTVVGATNSADGSPAVANLSQNTTLVDTGQTISPGVHLRGGEVVVRSGDTLWAIASRISRPDEDVRRVIHQIQQENALDTALVHPGQVLTLPK